MSRNRLTELQPQTGYDGQQSTQRNEFQTVDLESGNPAGLVAGEPYEMQERQLTMREFLEEIDDIKATTGRLDAQLNRIDQLQSDSLAAPDTASNAELDSLVASTTSTINSLRTALDRLASDAKKGGPEGQNKALQHNAQRKRLQDYVQRFRLSEQAYQNRLRVRAIRQYQIVNPDISEEEINQALIDPNTQIFQQALLGSSRSSQAKSTLSQVQSRHNDILRIERQIAELGQLFNELGIMVTEQEIHIDNIDRRAAETENKLKDGSQQLTRAVRFARLAREKKWWCFWLCVIIIIIIVVIVVVTHFVNHSSSSGSSSSSTPTATITIGATATLTP